MANSPTRSPLPQRIAGSRAHLFGISAALVTPFDSSGAINFPAAEKHARRVIDSGADSITLFGTTGEGASIGLSERAALLDHIVDAVVDAARVNVCICANDLELARAQAEQALVRGIRTLLLMPPFYFKGVEDRALAAWFTLFIEGLPTREARLILYHIPQVTQISLSIPLIRQLKDRYGDTIFGVKDSSGDWEHIQALLGFQDLATLIGDERLLAKAAPLGGAGAISGMANFTADMLSRIVHSGVDNDILCKAVDEVVRHPVTPMVKAMVGAFYGEPGWTNVRPPLSPALETVARQLINMLKDNHPE